MERQFKNGDRVRTVKDYESGWFKAGEEFVVVDGYPADRTGSEIVIIDVPSEGGTGGFFPEYFEKVSNDMTQVNLNLTDGTYGDLKVVQGKIIRGRKDLAAVPFGKQLVVDVRARNSTNPDTHAFLDATIAAASALGLGIRYVENLGTFFDPKARYAAFVKTGDTQGVELSTEEQAALKLVEGIKAKFAAAFTLPEPPKAPYVRATKPDSIKDPLVRFKFNKTSISSGSYRMGYTTAKRVWEEAREKWRGRDVNDTSVSTRYGSIVRASGYSFRLEIYGNRIEIGCQSVRRYELEAIAEKMGWEF